MEQLSYSESRNTQENQDFHNELNSSLLDNAISKEEAARLWEKYTAIRDTLVSKDWAEKGQILAITHDELSELAKWLDIDENSNLYETIHKLLSHSKVANKESDIETPVDAIPNAIEEPVEKEEEAEPKDEMIEVVEEPDSLESLSEYFGVSNLKEINNELTKDGLDLDIIQYLKWYKDYIENDLSDLNKEIKNKIILSLNIRISNLWKEIDTVKTAAREEIKKQNSNIESDADKIDYFQVLLCYNNIINHRI